MNESIFPLSSIQVGEAREQDSSSLPGFRPFGCRVKNPSLAPEKLLGKIYPDYDYPLEQRRYISLGYVHFPTKQSFLRLEDKPRVQSLSELMHTMVEFGHPLGADYDKANKYNQHFEKELAKIYRQVDHFQFHVIVVGYHDKRRSTEPDNPELARQRAREVAEALVQGFQKKGDDTKGYDAVSIEIPLLTPPPALSGGKGRLFVYYRGEYTADPDHPVLDWDPGDRRADIMAHGVLVTKPVPKPVRPLREPGRLQGYIRKSGFDEPFEKEHDIELTIRDGKGKQLYHGNHLRLHQVNQAFQKTFQDQQDYVKSWAEEHPEGTLFANVLIDFRKQPLGAPATCEITLEFSETPRGFDPRKVDARYPNGTVIKDGAVIFAYSWKVYP